MQTTTAPASEPTFLRRPVLAIVAVVTLVGLALAATGALTTRQSPDSPEYLRLAQRPLASQSLLGTRTIGYPVMLWTVERTIGLRWLALLQYGLISGATVLLVAVLVRYGVPSLVAWLIGCGALLSRLVADCSFIMTDSVAYGALIAVGAMLIPLAAGRGRVWHWVALTLLVFASCLIRPAYLFLVVVPPLFLFLAAVRRRRTLAGPQVRQRVMASGLAAALVVLPLAGFAGVRRALTGELGLSSFSGVVLFGLAGNLVTPEMVPELSPDMQRFARQVLERRQDPAVLAKAGLLHFTPANVGSRADYQAVMQQYDMLIYYVGKPLAAEWTDGTPSAVNRLLQRFSTAVLRQAWQPYLHWVAQAGGVFLFRSLHHLGMVLILMAAVVACLVRIVLGLPSDAAADESHGSDVTVVDDVMLLAVLILVCKALLVVAVEMPINRYVDAGAVLLPVFPAVWLTRELRVLMGAWRSVRS